MQDILPSTRARLEVGAFATRRNKQHYQWTMLVERFYQQIRYGCQNAQCNTPTCLTTQERVYRNKGCPYRRPTRSTATALATALASEPNPESRLCRCTMNPVEDGDGAFAGTPPGQVIDDKSLIQQLFNTDAWKTAGATTRRDLHKVRKLAETIFLMKDKLFAPFELFVSSMEARLASTENISSWSTDDIDVCFEYMHDKLLDIDSTPDENQRLMLLSAASILIILLEPHPHEFPEANWTQWLVFSTAVGNGPLVPNSRVQPNDAKFYKYLHCALSRPALNCATTFFRLLYRHGFYSKFFAVVYPGPAPPREVADIKTLSPQYKDSLMEVLCVWAKLVFRDNWESIATLEAGTDEHCALRFLEELILCNEHNVWPFYKESYARMSLVGDRIDIVKDPPKWINRKDGDPEIHLLQFKWLFSQRERVVFFRSMNFHRMLKSFEKAMESNALMARMENAYKDTSRSQARMDEIRSRLKSSTSTCLTLSVRRERIIEDAFNHLWRREQRELLRPLKVKFTNEEVGEEGVDLGGLQQEFFKLALAEALHPKLGLFKVDPTNRMAYLRAMSPAPLYQFALVGMLFGLAIYNGITLPVTFPHFFYKWLKGTRDVELEDLKDGWPDVYQSLKSLEKYEGDDLEDVFSIDKTFTLDLIGRRIELDMDAPFQPDDASIATGQERGGLNAAPVTRANRDEYLKSYAEYLLCKTVRPQLDAFHSGFSVLFSQKDLDILTAEDFRKMVEGEQTIDVAALKRVARYEDGFHADSQTIQNFWKVVETYNQEQLRALLEFVTATDRMPVSGMQDLVFVIMKSGDGGPDARRLPSSHTCFNRLMLPDYPSREILEDRLEVMLRNSEGFGIA